MSGFDILFDVKLEYMRLQKVIAQIMNIPVDRVFVIEDLASYPRCEDADCVCLVTHTEGQFPLRVAIDYNEACWVRLSVDFASCLAKSLQCNCLISDESSNPYCMIHFNREGTSRVVFIETVALDERGEYNLDANTRL